MRNSLSVCLFEVLTFYDWKTLQTLPKTDPLVPNKQPGLNRKWTLLIFLQWHSLQNIFGCLTRRSLTLVSAEDFQFPPAAIWTKQRLTKQQSVTAALRHIADVCHLIQNGVLSREPVSSPISRLSRQCWMCSNLYISDAQHSIQIEHIFRLFGVYPIHNNHIYKEMLLLGHQQQSFLNFGTNFCDLHSLFSLNFRRRCGIFYIPLPIPHPPPPPTTKR